MFTLCYFFIFFVHYKFQCQFQLISCGQNLNQKFSSASYTSALPQTKQKNEDRSFRYSGQPVIIEQYQSRSHNTKRQEAAAANTVSP